MKSEPREIKVKAEPRETDVTLGQQECRGGKCNIGSRGSTGSKGDRSEQGCFCAFPEPAWHFNAKFVNGEGYEMVKVPKETGGHGLLLEMTNSTYYFPYDLASSKENIIYMVHQDRKL